MPTATTETTGLLFPEGAVRELVISAINLARRTTQRNVSDRACVQWTLEERYIDGRWRSTLEPEDTSEDESPFTEDEVRVLLARAISVARRTSQDNFSDEACVQRVMRDRFGPGGWRSTLRDADADPIVSDTDIGGWPMTEDWPMLGYPGF